MTVPVTWEDKTVQQQQRHHCRQHIFYVTTLWRSCLLLLLIIINLVITSYKNISSKIFTEPFLDSYFRSYTWGRTPDLLVLFCSQARSSAWNVFPLNVVSFGKTLFIFQDLVHIFLCDEASLDFLNTFTIISCCLVII